MVVTPFRLFLFIVAAFVAAAGTAYYTGALEAYFAPGSRQVAQEKATNGAGSDAAGSAKSSEETKAGAQENEADDAASKDAATQKNGDSGKGNRVIVPAFDIVRVEPDGSMVIAGRAGPDSNIEVVSGSTIIGKTQSGPDGDFAVVLDEPLKPGNYQIVLRATSPKDVVATSKETAVVSVPDNKDGKVLALVEEPGKPSRLITKPAALEGKAQETAEADNGKAQESEASQGAADKTAEGQADVATAQPPESGSTEAGTAGSGQAGEAAQGQGAGAVSDAGDKDAAPAENGTVPAASDTASAAGEAASGTTGDNSVASGDAAQDGKAAAKDDRSDAKVFIEAVEIDGKDIFVAGGGVPGQRVRVYANDILLGDAVVSPNGRFLVQATRELPVGDYIVRADLLSDNGADVMARAAVPFEREPGEKLAAVAPKTGLSGGDKAAANETAAAPTAPQASKSEAGQSASASGSAQGEKAPTASGSSTQESASPAEIEGGMKLPDLHNGLAENAPVITAPKLEAVDGAVIIRRGDTLWHISRRVYGHGIRFSTIYLANQGQIRDPDRIWPGQVFSVPEKTKSGEAADMKAIGDQAVPSDMAGTEPSWRR